MRFEIALERDRIGFELEVRWDFDLHRAAARDGVHESSEMVRKMETPGLELESLALEP